MTRHAQPDLFADGARMVAAEAVDLTVASIEVPRPLHHVVKFSGGQGSWGAAKRVVARHGTAGVILLFTDTLAEDPDAYRFLIAGAAVVLGVHLPTKFLPSLGAWPAWEDRGAFKAFVLALRAEAAVLLPQLVWLVDGRDPFDVFDDERFLGNSRRDPCSKILKRQPAVRWLADHHDPADTILYVGIDHFERHRFDGRAPAIGIRRRFAAMGWRCEAPLCEPPWVAPWDVRDQILAAGLWVTDSYRQGFAHDNCGGLCCKMGCAQAATLLRTRPARYAYGERREKAFRERIGADVAMLTDRVGGAKKPLTLRELRLRIEADPQLAASFDDEGGCNCFFGGDA